MTRLADSTAVLKPHYEIVVIGSGYGGGVSASRLARAGRQVCLLERGREFQPGEYPNRGKQLRPETQFDLPKRHLGSPSALFDLRVNDDINVLLGCGLGGTSLINAGVSLRVLPRVFKDERWPVEIRREAESTRGGSDDGGWEFRPLNKYYLEAENMLRPSPYPDHYPKLPKTAALELAARNAKLPFYHVPINVNFDNLKDGLNHVGVSQNPCVNCGDCSSGCNYAAKNTLIMNYLPDAKHHGAEIHTEVSVRYIERRGDQWIVHCRRLNSGSSVPDPAEVLISADIVILAAGTLGSSEILFRSRENGLALSDALGSTFSGNGDVIGWTRDTAPWRTAR